MELKRVTSSSNREVIPKFLLSGQKLKTEKSNLIVLNYRMFSDIKVNLPSHFDTRLPLNLAFTLAMRITFIVFVQISCKDKIHCQFQSNRGEQCMYPCIHLLQCSSVLFCLLISLCHHFQCVYLALAYRHAVPLDLADIPTSYEEESRAAIFHRWQIGLCLSSMRRQTDQKIERST